MRIADFACRALGFGTVAALLSGCGGSQTSIGTRGAIPQAPITAADLHGRSWMLPEAKRENLVYYSVGNYSGYPATFVFSLGGKLVGGLNVAGRLCSDDMGNVWIAGYPNGSGVELAEYAHGGAEPIETLDAPSKSPSACAVDPTTGNLAAVDNGDVDIFYSGSSYPQILVDTKLALDDLTYDGSGNLFIIGESVSRHRLEVAELPKETTKFEGRWGIIGLSATSGFRWDGKHLTIGDGLDEGGHELWRYVVRGNRLESRG
ncbi:MAG: hypothetical protein WBW89_16960, partial [Candidatus Cybelea sp.]